MSVWTMDTVLWHILSHDDPELNHQLLNQYDLAIMVTLIA